jgi:hypothetical protein
MIHSFKPDNIKEEIKSLKRRHEKFLNQRKEVENSSMIFIKK